MHKQVLPTHNGESPQNFVVFAMPTLGKKTSSTVLVIHVGPIITVTAGGTTEMTSHDVADDWARAELALRSTANYSDDRDGVRRVHVGWHCAVEARAL